MNESRQRRNATGVDISIEFIIICINILIDGIPFISINFLHNLLVVSPQLIFRFELIRLYNHELILMQHNGHTQRKLITEQIILFALNWFKWIFERVTITTYMFQSLQCTRLFQCKMAYPAECNRYRFGLYLLIWLLNCFRIHSHRGRPAHLTAPDYTDTDGITGPAEEEASVIVQLTNRVQDGTRCRSGSLDMCIQGKCQVSHSHLRIQ